MTDPSDNRSNREKKALSLTEKEAKLISLIREIGFGEILLVVEEGEPVQLEEVKKSTKL